MVKRRLQRYLKRYLWLKYAYVGRRKKRLMGGEGLLCTQKLLLSIIKILDCTTVQEMEGVIVYIHPGLMIN